MTNVDWIVGEDFDVVEWRLEGGDLRIELLDGSVMWRPETPTPVVVVEIAGVAASDELRADLGSLEAEGVWAIGQETSEAGPVVVFEGEGWSRRVACRHVGIERREPGARHFVRVVRALRQQLESLRTEARASTDTVVRTRTFLHKGLDRAQRLLDSMASDHPARQRLAARLRCLQEALNVLES